MPLTIKPIKLAVADDGVELRLDLHLAPPKHGWYADSCYRVDLVVDGRLMGCNAYDTLHEALEHWYQMVEDGAKYNGYGFKTVDLTMKKETVNG